MKKKSNSFVPALGILAVLCAAYGLITFWQADDKTSAMDAEDIYITNLEKPVSLSWNKYGEGLVFTRQDSTWYYKDDRDCPIRQYPLDNLADTLAGLKAVRWLEGAGGLGEYGLDSPSARFDIEGGENKNAAVLIGDPVPGTGEDGGSPDYYACLDGQTEVYTIGGYLMETAEKGLYDFVETETLPYVSAADIKEITVAKQGKTSHFYKNTEDDTNISWYTGSLGGEGSRLPDNAQLNNLAEAISGLSISSCAAYKADRGELEDYGLLAPSMTLTWNYEKGEDKGSVTLSIGNPDSGKTGYYVKTEDSMAVNIISKESVERCLNAEYPE